MADIPLTEKEVDLLQSGLAQPVRIYEEDMPLAEGLSKRGLAVVTGVRSFLLKTTGDGAVAIAKARRPKARRPLQPAFAGLNASECNEWLATLPPVPAWGQ
jgi:hypothetical protein